MVQCMKNWDNRIKVAHNLGLWNHLDLYTGNFCLFPKGSAELPLLTETKKSLHAPKKKRITRSYLFCTSEIHKRDLLAGRIVWLKNSLSSVPCWHILRLTSIFDTNVTHDVELTLFVDKFKVFSYPNQMKERLNIRTIEVTFSLHKTQSRKKNWPFQASRRISKIISRSREIQNDHACFTWK